MLGGRTLRTKMLRGHFVGGCRHRQRRQRHPGLLDSMDALKVDYLDEF
jgi:hypothetical protein